ncbi:MAG: helix-turn-helix domain-containing protein, partial [Acidobacteriia bacterium]|nr:helix-turn-helix domain-containing protein [Terriglobia bacterium]
MKTEPEDNADERARKARRAIGSKIRQLREKKGWSQRDFAAVCGCHRSYVGQVERGETNVTLSTLALFAGRLNSERYANHRSY